MKRTHNPHNRIVAKCCLLLLFCIFIASCTQTSRKEVLLKKALNKLESIESAEYQEKLTTYIPGDTINKRWYTSEIESYNNPKDTTIGASWVKFSIEKDSKRFQGAYNGQISATAYHQHKGILLNDFTTRKLPFRPMTPPFFFYAKSVVEYTLSTTDSIEVSVTENDKEYHLSLTIHEPNQVEFFGRGYQMPELPESMKATHDPTSHYEIWFDKHTNLPSRLYREMCHNISDKRVNEVKLNTLSINDLHIEDYYPDGYEIRMLKDKKQANAPKTKDLVGHPAPLFTLKEANGEEVTLSQIESKAILLNFTGIGCGPCMQAIPMLRNMTQKFSPSDLQIISIESWGKEAQSLRLYAQKYQINYPFLVGEKGLLSNYHISGVPVFVLIDSSHTVRYVHNGYSHTNSDKQILKQIELIVSK